MIHYIEGPLLEDLCNQSGATAGVSFATSLTEVLANVLDHEVKIVFTKTNPELTNFDILNCEALRLFKNACLCFFPVFDIFVG